MITLIIFLLMLKPQTQASLGPDLTLVDRIEVGYSSGPLPPAYASWYELVLTPDSAHYVSEKRGQRVEQTWSMTDEQWHGALEALRASGVRPNEGEYVQPIGGASYTLYLYHGDSCLLGGHKDACGTGTILMTGFPTDVVSAGANLPLGVPSGLE